MIVIFPLMTIISHYCYNFELWLQLRSWNSCWFLLVFQLPAGFLLLIFSNVMKLLAIEFFGYCNVAIRNASSHNVCIYNCIIIGELFVLDICSTMHDVLVILSGNVNMLSGPGHGRKLRPGSKTGLRKTTHS